MKRRLAALLLFGSSLGAWPASAQTLTTHYSFTGGSDGARPRGGLIADATGNFYGTTATGGDMSCDSPYGCGTVFQLTPSGTLTVLHSFTGTDGAAYPFAGVIADAAGNLYGTSVGGGGLGCDIAPGCGTVFRLAPSGALNVLHSFAEYGDGAVPSGGLIADAAGNFYGTTQFGGQYDCDPDYGGCGTVFQLTPSGTLTVLHSFTGSSDGANPDGLIADAAGNLYGTTYAWGPGGSGTVFQLTPLGTLTVLYSFTGGSDGALPSGALIVDAAGNLYGTTTYGGAGGYGTVFQLTPSGNLIVLHSFTGGSDGGGPGAGLIADAAGNLYGTTVYGGNTTCTNPVGCGTVFQLTPSGTLSVLYSFTGGSDGAYPSAGLIADAAGNLYGTTDFGGNTSCNSPVGCGTVFQLTVPARFTGVPGGANCIRQSISLMVREYGGTAHAAAGHGYASVTDLEKAVAAYCGG